MKKPGTRDGRSLQGDLSLSPRCLQWSGDRRAETPAEGGKDDLEEMNTVERKNSQTEWKGEESEH